MIAMGIALLGASLAKVLQQTLESMHCHLVAESESVTFKSLKNQNYSNTKLPKGTGYTEKTLKKYKINMSIIRWLKQNTAVYHRHGETQESGLAKDYNKNEQTIPSMSICTMNT